MRFSSSLVASVYLGFAAAAAIPAAPAVAAVHAQSTVSTYVSPLPTQTSVHELHVRMLPNLGNPAAPLPKPTVPAALPVKVPRGGSEVLGAVLDAAGKVGRKGAIGMARREDTPPTVIPSATSSIAVPGVSPLESTSIPNPAVSPLGSTSFPAPSGTTV